MIHNKDGQEEVLPLGDVTFFSKEVQTFVEHGKIHSIVSLIELKVQDSGNMEEDSVLVVFRVVSDTVRTGA